MDRDLRLVWLYCVIEDAVRQILGETRLRSRGPTPALTADPYPHFTWPVKVLIRNINF